MSDDGDGDDNIRSHSRVILSFYSHWKRVIESLTEKNSLSETVGGVGAVFWCWWVTAL